MSAIGGWDQQVVTYTGNGIPGRAVATTFPLDVGVVAIWILGVLSIGGGVFRHNAMTGSVYGTSPLRTDSGIMSFTSTGFTVTDNTGQNMRCNVNGAAYVAVVIRDTTSDNRYMRVGD